MNSPPQSDAPGRETSLRQRYAQALERIANLEQVLDANPLPQIVASSVGVVVEANPSAVALAGATNAAELRGRDLSTLVPDSRRKALAGCIEFVLREGHCEGIPIAVRRPDGSLVPVQWIMQRLDDGAGRARGLLVTLRDIREQQRAEDVIRESESRLRAVFEASPDAITVFDLDGTITAANQQWARLMGFGDVSAALAHSRQLLDWVAPHHRDTIHRGLSSLRDLSEPQVYECRFLRPNGSSFLAEVTVSPIRDMEGAPSALIGITRDITAIRRAQEALRESEQKYRRLFDTVPDGILLYDTRSLEIIDANAAALHMHGYKRDELMGLPIGSLEPEQSTSPATTDAGRSPLRPHQSSHVRRDGTLFPVEISAENYQLGPRNVTCQVLRDVTAQVEGERRLERLNVLKEDLLRAAPLEEKLRRVTDELVQQFGADVARIWIVRPGDLCDGGCKYRSRGEEIEQCPRRGECLYMAANSDLSKDSENPENLDPWAVPFGCDFLAGSTLSEESPFLIDQASDAPQTPDHQWARARGLKSFAGYRLFSPSGEVIGVLAIFSQRPITPEDDVFFAGLAATASQIVWMANAEEERHQLVTAIEQSGEMVITADARLKMQYINPAFYRITGFSCEDTTDRLLSDFLDAADPAPEQGDCLKTLANGQVWAGRITCRRKDDSSFVADAVISPVRDDRQRVVSIVAQLRDVSEIVEMESQLRQSQKMEAIGTLAGGIAHDFNNMLYAILGFADLAIDDVAPDSIANDCLRRIRTAGERASCLVKQILAFSHPGKVESAPIALDQIVREALDFMRGSLPATIELWPHIDANCGPVLADPTQIHQIIINLCSNAFHAMRDSCGVLTVSLCEVTLSEEDAQSILDLSPGQYARLSIQDTGVGMDETVRRRIFEPYFTTKTVGEGTGMGLATVHSIVTSMNGSISVQSRIGEGSRFDIFLPIHASASEEPDVPHRDGKATPGNERILLVDDEDAIVRLGKLHLGGLGYDVAGFTDPRQAIEIFRADPGGFDALITDHAMPHVSGVQLAGHIRQLRPDLPIILCTGFSGMISKEPAALAEIDMYLEKPIEMRALARSLRSLLDESIERGA